MKQINLYSEDRPAWNIRLMGFKDYNAFDKEAYSYEFVEVFYEDGIPHSWASIGMPFIDSLDVERSGKALKTAMIKEWVSFKKKINEALDAPVLYEEDLHTSQ